MKQNYLCITIPAELQQYTKFATNNDSEITSCQDNFSYDFGVKLIKDDKGNIQYTAYYSDTGELIKKIYYEGSSVSSIEHYRNNYLYSQEKYYDGKITKVIKFNRNAEQICSTSYEYNRNDQIVIIRKNVSGNAYFIEYGYDVLMRVNSRIVKINNKVVVEQRYKYDILDRIVEYKDNNQSINVLKINPKNQLLYYVITDKIGNTISITNKFICSDYIGTEIDLNGHKTTVKDISYTDNVMLKKPFTSEDDLDLVISKMFNRSLSEPELDFFRAAHRSHNTEIISSVMQNNVISAQKPLPILRRKLRLLQYI